MGKVRVDALSISLDGFACGPNQSMDAPLGVGGHRLHEWFHPTKTFQEKVMGNAGGTTGPDNDFAERSFRDVGAWILGRNMFAPSRGPWPDDGWKGWWGDEPPYHVPTFILTHHPREPIPMAGGTTFHFVTGGIEDALDQARRAADGRDVRIGGGAQTIRQFLEARLVDEMHLVISPIVLGQGEPLLQGIDLAKLGYETVQSVGTPKALHVVLKRRP